MRHACAWYAVPCGTWVYMPFGFFPARPPQAPQGPIVSRVIPPSKWVLYVPQDGLGIGWSFGATFFFHVTLEMGKLPPACFYQYINPQFYPAGVLRVYWKSGMVFGRLVVFL